MDVSIIIPAFNRLDLTRECLASLFRHTESELDYEVIVVDDCSRDETPEYLGRMSASVRVFRNAERRGYAFNNNLGAREARGTYLCFLNNDTLVTPGWLMPMVRTLEGDASIAVVGNKHLFPDTGTIHHVGMALDEDLRPQHLYPHLDPSLPFVAVSRELQLVTAACWLVRRDVFLDLGGFDEAFKNGYEDCDFCLRARERGYKVWYCAESLIYHHGQASPLRKTHDDSNERLFLERWSGKVRSDLKSILEADGVTHINRLSKRPGSLGATSATDVHFAIDMGKTNAFTWASGALATALEDLGARVSVERRSPSKSIDPDQRTRLKTMMRRPVAKGVHIRWAHYWPAYLNKQTAGEINVEIFATNYLYGDCDEQKLDFWMRHLKYNHLYKLPISRFCRTALAEIGVTDDRLAVLPLGYSPEIADVLEADGDVDGQGFVFLAVTNSHDLVRYGTDRLIEAYAKSFEAADDVTLILHDYGVHAPREGIERLLERWKPTARLRLRRELLPKRDLLRLYRGAHCFVAPFRGEGFGMKVLDAFACGVPVVMTNFGGPLDYALPETYWPVAYKEVAVKGSLDANQHALPPSAFWAEPDSSDLADQMRRVFLESEEAQRRALRGKDHVLEHFSWRQAAAGLLGAVDSWHSRRVQRVRRRVSRVEVSGRRREISVVIPTYNRADTLRKTLEGYGRQTLPKDQWELVIVDDASPVDNTSVVRTFENELNVQFRRMPENRGPGQARNVALERASGKLVLITGDDMIPDKELLATHSAAHRAHPSPEVAILGQMKWHPELERAPVLHYITETSGLQFCLSGESEGSELRYDRFFTSNVSVKRDWLMVEDPVFEPAFKLAAYEDVELGFRLSRRGLRLFYHPSATVFHLHPMTRQSFAKRQHSVGRMLVIFTLIHPWAVPDEHKTFLYELENFKSYLESKRGKEARDSLVQLAEHLGPSMDAYTAFLEDWFDGERQPPNFKAATPFVKRLRRGAQDDLDSAYGHLFEWALRMGMAEEWMGTEDSKGLLGAILLSMKWGTFGAQDSDASFRNVLWRKARNFRHHPRFVSRFDLIAERESYKAAKQWFAALLKNPD